MTAALLEQNLRENVDWGDDQNAATSAADRLHAVREGESTAPVRFSGDEGRIVASSIDAMLAGPHESPTLLALLRTL